MRSPDTDAETGSRGVENGKKSNWPLGFGGRGQQEPRKIWQSKRCGTSFKEGEKRSFGWWRLLAEGDRIKTRGQRCRWDQPEDWGFVCLFGFYFLFFQKINRNLPDTVLPPLGRSASQHLLVPCFLSDSSSCETHWYKMFDTLLFIQNSYSLVLSLSPFLADCQRSVQ